jgi:hypothetical protein
MDVFFFSNIANQFTCNFAGRAFAFGEELEANSTRMNTCEAQQ